ncbi:MAG: YncE family protein [Solirubrobacteraceae bacterium]
MLDRREFLALGFAAAPALVAATPRRATTTRPAALATADAEAHVAVVSLSSMRVVQRLATVGDPRSIESAPGGRAVLAHAASGAITLIEGRPLRVRRVLRGFGAPRYTAIRPGGKLAYVSDSGHGEIAVVDLVAGRVVRRLAVGAGARHLTLHPDGRTLWVVLGSSAAAIAVLDVREPERPRVIARVRPPFLAHDAGFSPSGLRVWVTAGRESRIAVYDAGRRTPVRVLRADVAPQHVAFGGGVAYVVSGEAGTLAVHALADAALRRRTRIPAGSYNVQRTGGRVVTPSLATGRLTVLDRHGVVAGQARVAASAHDACIVS